MKTIFFSPFGKVLSTVALTSSIVLASVNSASACPFSKNKGLNTDFTFNPPSFNISHLKGNTLGILGISSIVIAALGGYYGFKRKQRADLAQSDDFSSESFFIPVYSEKSATSGEKVAEKPISSVK